MRCLVRLMTANARCHSKDRRSLSNGICLADVTVACLAGNSRVQVRSVGPGDAGRHFIHAYPGNFLVRIRICLKSHNRWLFRCQSRVAHHACFGFRKRHMRARLRIYMAGTAYHPYFQVLLMAERQRLIGRRVRRDVLGYQGSGRLTGGDRRGEHKC